VSPDVKLMLLFGGLHLVALALLSMLLTMFLRSDTTTAWSPPDDDINGGGGSDRVRPPSPLIPGGGAPPLADARPARVRLRAAGRLAELLPPRERRPSREPERTPHRLPASR
jgi:hypothetical protein